MAIKFFAFFFSDNQYFRMFLVSMADIIGSYERLPNDAVRAVAVAKRREYEILWLLKKNPSLYPPTFVQETNCWTVLVRRFKIWNITKMGSSCYPFLLAIRCVFAHHFLQHHQVTIFHASAHAELVGFLLWDILKWRVDEASINGFHPSVGLDILLENLQENHEYL